MAAPEADKGPLDSARSILTGSIGLIADLFASLDNASSAGGAPAVAAPATDAADQPQTRPAELVRQLATAESRLQSLYTRLEAHQQLVGEVEKAARQLDDKNRSLLTFVKRLEQAHRDLEAVLVDARHKQGLMRQASQGAVDYRELLAYAHRVSKHTMSPLNASTWVVEPPIPQENHIRASLLFRQHELFNVQQSKENVTKVEDVGMDLDILGHGAVVASALAGTSARADSTVPAEALLDLDFE